MNEIRVNGKEYVPKDSIKFELATPKSKLPYKLVRTYSAGVFAGYLKKRNGKEATLINARRIWYWKGAASLSQLAMEGTSNPNECKFPCEVSKVELTEVIEVLDVTKKAQESIKNVKVWEQ